MDWWAAWNMILNFLQFFLASNWAINLSLWPRWDMLGISCYIVSLVWDSAFRILFYTALICLLCIEGFRISVHSLLQSKFYCFVFWESFELIAITLPWAELKSSFHHSGFYYFGLHLSIAASLWNLAKSYPESIVCSNLSHLILMKTCYMHYISMNVLIV